MTRAILLVEDDENDVLVMAMALEKAGLTCPIRVARDGREAQDYLSGAGKFADRSEYPLPYLMLLDLKLPRVMGLEVLKWLRERPEFDSTIVLILSSSSSCSSSTTPFPITRTTRRRTKDSRGFRQFGQILIDVDVGTTVSASRSSPLSQLLSCSYS